MDFSNQQFMDIMKTFGDATAKGEGSATINSLNQFLDSMTAKEVVYEPLLKAQKAANIAVEAHKNDDSKDVYSNFMAQKKVIDELIEIYSKPDFKDGQQQKEIDTLLDTLEQTEYLPGAVESRDVITEFNKELEANLAK